MNIKMKKLLLSFVLLTLSFSAFAATEDQVETTYSSEDKVNELQSLFLPAKCKNHFELILAGGPAGVHVRSSHLQVAEDTIFRLSQTNSFSWSYWAGEVGLGYVFNFFDGPRISSEWRWFPTFEPVLNVVNSHLVIRGNVYLNDTSTPTGVTYKHDIANTRLTLDGNLTIISKGHFSLYGLFGMGDSWTRLAYHGNGSNNPTFPSASLTTKQQDNIIWELGAGVVFAFNDKFGLSLEYRYSDLGREHNSNSGTVTNVTNPQLIGPVFDLYTQTALLGLRMALG